MNRTQLAAYGLIASAFVMASLICVRASAIIDTTARGEMVVHKDFVTILSTKSQRNDAEVVYMLESKSEHLLAYQVDPNHKTIELLASLDVAAEFGRRNGGGGKAPGGR